jgi:NAD(P) transhydrogenase subunit alpha
MKKIGLTAGNCLVGLLSPFHNKDIIEEITQRGINCYALELVPRSSRAQTMDVLSSQSNIAGYRAVLEALQEYGRIVPLMMTAAGAIRPARVLIVGAGVAGLQAIATAKRLGAVVSAFDVRSAAKEQVESLGATFVMVEDENGDGETVGGYAKEMDEAYKKRQSEKLALEVSRSDIVITTAQIPGRPAPKLIDAAMVKSMQRGSVIVDMATSTGGNCELSQGDTTVKCDGVTVMGRSNLAAKVSHDSSQLLARNIFNFIALMMKDGKIDDSDEIVQATLLKKA